MVYFKIDLFVTSLVIFTRKVLKFLISSLIEITKYNIYFFDKKLCTFICTNLTSKSNFLVKVDDEEALGENSKCDQSQF